MNENKNIENIFRDNLKKLYIEPTDRTPEIEFLFWQ